MGVKSAGSGSYDQLGIASREASSRLGKQMGALSKAKAGGASIGGLLGSVVGFLVAGPAGAAIGGGLGALGGSKIGESSAGGTGSLTKEKLYKGSQVEMMEDLAKSELSDTIIGAVSGYANAGSIGKAKDAFTGGWKAAGKGGMKGLLGGIKGVGKEFLPDFKDLTDFKGIGYKGLDKSLGGILPGGEKLNLKGIGKAAWGAADAGLGGYLPGGIKPLHTGEYGDDLINKTIGKLPGLLGHNETTAIGTSETIGSPEGDEMDFTDSLSAHNFGEDEVYNFGQDNEFYNFGAQIEQDVGINLDKPDFTNPEWVRQFQKRVMNMQEGDAGWGQFGPKTTKAYQDWYNK